MNNFIWPFFPMIVFNYFHCVLKCVTCIFKQISLLQVKNETLVKVSTRPGSLVVGGRLLVVEHMLIVCTVLNSNSSTKIRSKTQCFNLYSFLVPFRKLHIYPMSTHQSKVGHLMSLQQMVKSHSYINCSIIHLWRNMKSLNWQEDSWTQNYYIIQGHPILEREKMLHNNSQM